MPICILFVIITSRFPHKRFADCLINLFQKGRMQAMNSEKLESSETSSEETDLQEVQDGYSGTNRSYECTFCRKGFTNAQALGGHMNIHRKDRAKVKQVITPNSSSLPSKFSSEESMTTSPFISEISPSQEPSRYYSIFEAQRNYNMYYHPAATNPRNSTAYARQYEFLTPRSQPFNANQDLLGADLSLQIGPSLVEDSEVRRAIQKDSEVDLELRLGQDPY